MEVTSRIVLFVVVALVVATLIIIVAATQTIVCSVLLSSTILSLLALSSLYVVVETAAHLGLQGVKRTKQYFSIVSISVGYLQSAAVGAGGERSLGYVA